jgi:hypothetical protein
VLEDLISMLANHHLEEYWRNPFQFDPMRQSALGHFTASLRKHSSLRETETTIDHTRETFGRYNR